MVRNQALDLMRGFTVAAMILVNTPGSWEHIYWPLEHAEWQGLTPTDLVFPFFLFMVGSALCFARDKWMQQSHTDVIQKIVKRSVVIFAIGLVLNAYPFQKPLEQLRIMGVLQRIALCYGVAALMVLYCGMRLRRFLIAAIVFSYALLFAVFGGDHPYAFEQSIATQFDIAVLGANHLWLGKGQPFDPEGLLSTWPAVASVLIGFEITALLRQQTDARQALRNITIWGSGLLAFGLLSAHFIPLNKSLWTSSYVLVSAGIATLFLALITRFAEKSPWHFGNPLWLAFGLNPLFIYIVSWLWVDSYALIQWTDVNGVQRDVGNWLFSQFNTVLSEKNASLLFAVTHVLLFYVMARQLYRRKIIIKI